ncbi:radical SAM protein [Enterococcus faecalis]|uniref:radical SAM protein n=1 Tax=Enterococcus faecalis TaxID=1351 RepID=UPI003F7FECE1
MNGLVNVYTMDELDSFFAELFLSRKFYQLAKTFQTKNRKYLYDTGTGKVFECNDDLFKVLQIWENKKSYVGIKSLFNEYPFSSNIIKELSELKNVILKENMLQAKSVEKFDSPHLYQLEESITSDLQLITLELTEKCNLRCSYCIYGEMNCTFRGFGTKSMTFETAKNAIDYAKKHAGENFSLTFYGGEPLIEFDLIKKCVDYAKKQLSDRNLIFSITTNLVLMTEEVAEYIAGNENFYVVCSMDGPEDIHDEYRVFQNGKGSFRHVFNGLRRIVDALGESANDRLSFSMVLNRPYTDEKFERIQNFFEENQWIPKEAEKNITYASYGRDAEGEAIIPKEETTDLLEGEEETLLYDPLGDWNNKKVIENNSYSAKLFTSKRSTDDMYRIHNRRLTEKPVDNYSFNGCCIPGSRRLYVTVNGEFKLCERIGESPKFGDVENGIDLDIVRKKYIDNYMNESVKLCNECWAVNMCGLCYTDSYDEEDFRLDYKSELCDSQRFQLERALGQYHEILEEDPQSLEYLNHIVMG